MQQNQYQYLPVHWIDGMKINKSHFISQNNAYTSQLAQGISGLLNEYNYGLLPNTQNSNNGLKVFVTTDNQQQVQVRLQKCKAITFGGYVIELDEDLPVNGGYVGAEIPNMSVSFSELKGKAVDYLIILVVNPYERIPYGFADPSEMPPRLPYTLPSYSMQLVPVNEVTSSAIGNFQLPIGKLKILEQKVILDENYIAPCSSVSSHPDLLEIHADLENFFGKMELYALQIIQKVLQKKQLNEKAIIIQKICESITFFTASHLGNFKLIHIHQPPVFLINTVSSFARIIKNTLDFYIGSGKEELINYFTGWCDVNQGELENALTTLANHQYNHLNVNDSIEKVASCTKVIYRLFAKIASLDYIGQRKDNDIFVKEQIIPKETGLFKQDYIPSSEPEPKAKKSRISFAD